MHALYAFSEMVLMDFPKLKNGTSRFLFIRLFSTLRHALDDAAKYPFCQASSFCLLLNFIIEVKEKGYELTLLNEIELGEFYDQTMSTYSRSY